MAVKPISPPQARTTKSKRIPDAVFEVFNDLITKHLENGTADVKQEEVVSILVREKKMKRAEIFANHWLDVEDHYRKAGWSVEYDKPGYCETYDAFWTFKAKRAR